MLVWHDKIKCDVESTKMILLIESDGEPVQTTNLVCV